VVSPVGTRSGAGSGRAAAPVNGEPQLLQKLLASGLSWPQLVQNGMVIASK
jgi:hypothetical protein